MPSASISTTSPAFMKTCGFWKTPTPAGVPVVTMSPGYSGMKPERKEMSCGSGNSQSDVLPSVM